MTVAAAGVLLPATPAVAAAPAPPASARVFNLIGGLARPGPARRMMSSNWAGYVRRTPVTDGVAGSWTVPAVVPTRSPEYSASWVGIDGVRDESLIQAGTGQDTANGKTFYYAWWEVLPAPETVIASMVVAAGDRMTATINRLSGVHWTITLTDLTTVKTWSARESYRGPATSAEWIEEAPAIDGVPTTLADFGTVDFRAVRVDRSVAGLLVAQAVDMIDRQGVIARPSAPGAGADAFGVTYARHIPAGTTPPAVSARPASP